MERRQISSGSFHMTISLFTPATYLMARPACIQLCLFVEQSFWLNVTWCAPD